MEAQQEAAAEPISRPVGGTEYSWCRAALVGTGTTVLAVLLSRPLPTPLLRSTLHNLHNSHPILRARLTLPAASHPFITIPTDSPTTDESLIQNVDSSATASLLAARPVSPFHALLEHELCRNSWAKPEHESESESESVSHPVFFVTVYELPGSAEPSRQLLALRLHTGFCDRIAAVHVLEDLLGLIGDKGDGEGKCGEREEGWPVVPPIEDLIPPAAAWKPFWARGKDLLGYSLNGLRSSGLPFEEAGPPKASEVVRLVLDRDVTRKLLDACESRGLKLYAALSASGLIATYSSKHLEVNQSETYSMVTLVNCRKYLEPVLQEHDIGFYHSAILNTHTVCSGEELWELAMRCHQSFSTAKNNKKHLTDIGDLNYLMCKAIDNPHLTPSSSLRTAVISVFEESVIYESSESQLQLGVEDYIGCASVHGVGPSLAVFDTIRDGQLDCAFVYPSPLHSRKQMEELLEHIKKILVDGSCEVELES